MSWVLIRCGPHLPHGRLWLQGTEVTIGRAPSNTFMLNSSYISRRHATFNYNIQENKWDLKDNKSANGIFINGIRTNAQVPYTLIEGDTIGFGAPPSAQSSNDVFIYKICIEIKQEPVDNPSAPSLNSPKAAEAELQAALDANGNVPESLQLQDTEPTKGNSNDNNTVGDSIVASKALAEVDPGGSEKTTSETIAPLNETSEPSRGTLEKPTSASNVVAAVAAVAAAAAAVQVAPTIEQTTTQTRLKLSSLSLKSSAGRSVTIKQEPGTTKSSFTEKLPGQNLVPVAGPVPTSCAVQGENASNSQNSTECVFNMKSLEGSLTAVNSNLETAETIGSGSNGHETASVKIKIDHSALLQRIIVLDSDDEDEEDNLGSDNAVNAGDKGVGDIDDEWRVKTEVDSDSSDGDVTFVKMGYSQEHEVYEISDDEEYFSSSQPSAATQDPEATRDENVGDEAPRDGLGMCLDLPEDYVYDEMDAEASRSPDMALDKPGPSGLQMKSGMLKNTEDAAVDQADDDISDEMDQVDDDLSDEVDQVNGKVPARNGLVNGDEQQFFPVLSQDISDEDKELDGSKEDGEVSDESDEPDEQSIRNQAKNYVKPMFTATQTVAKADRKTMPTEPLRLNTSIRRDKRHIDRGSRENGELSPPPAEPTPVTPKKSSKLIAARPMAKKRGTTSNKKKAGLKENVMKGYDHRVPIPGGGSAVIKRGSEAKVNGNVPPKSKKPPSSANKQTKTVPEGGALTEVDLFGSENVEDEDSEPSSKRGKEDCDGQKKKGNTVSTGDRFGSSRNAKLTEDMLTTPGAIAGKRRSSDPKKAPDAKRAKSDSTAPNVRVVSTATCEGDGASKGFAVRVCASPETVEDHLLPNIDISKGGVDNSKEKKSRGVTFAKDVRDNEPSKLKRKALSPKQIKRMKDNEAYKGKVIEFNSVNDIFFTILYWNVNWPKERHKNGSNLPAVLGHPFEEAMATISNYENFSDYCQIFSRLLLYETWESVCSAVVERKAQPTFNFTVFASRSSFQEVNILECNVRVEKECDGLIHPQKGHFVQVHVALKKTSADECFKYTPRYGYITESRELHVHEMNHIPEMLVGKDKANIFSPRWKIMRVSIMVRLREGKNAKVDMNKLMKMEIITNIKGMVRYFEALFSLARSPLLKDILEPQWKTYHLIEEEHKEYRNFNRLQTAAIKKIVHSCYNDSSKICLVQGPPGTGKTKVVSHIVIDLLFGKYANERPHSRPQILLCAPSNAAVDEDICRVMQFTDALAKDKKKINILRIGPETSISASVKHLSFNTTITAEKQSIIERLKRELQVKNNEIKTCTLLLDAMTQEQKDSADGLGLQMKLGHESIACDALTLQLEAAKTPRTRNEDFNHMCQDMFRKADVIASTLDSIYCDRLAYLYKRSANSNRHLVCIIDEAAQATEPATLVPLMYPVSKLILVGDHKQLPATVQSPIAAQFNLKQSLFERLNKCFAYTAKTPCIMLTTQYRMHPEICQFPSRAFYEGKLETDRNIVQSYATRPFQPYVLFNVYNGLEQVGPSKGEIYNTEEAKIVCELCKVVLRPDRAPLSVGVITFYRCQKQQIIRLLKERLGSSAEKVEVNTVDGFQGREKDVIILSTVRAQGKMGFLEDTKRLNVALTRAKSCFYICGHVATLETHSLWADLIGDARDRGKIENISNDKDMEYLEQFVLKVV